MWYTSCAECKSGACGWIIAQLDYLRVLLHGGKFELLLRIMGSVAGSLSRARTRNARYRTKSCTFRCRAKVVTLRFEPRGKCIGVLAIRQIAI